jgi:hypothetical protein
VPPAEVLGRGVDEERAARGEVIEPGGKLDVRRLPAGAEVLDDDVEAVAVVVEEAVRHRDLEALVELLRAADEAGLGQAVVAEGRGRSRVTASRVDTDADASDLGAPVEVEVEGRVPRAPPGVAGPVHRAGPPAPA